MGTQKCVYRVKWYKEHLTNRFLTFVFFWENLGSLLPPLGCTQMRLDKLFPLLPSSSEMLWFD